MKKYFVTMLVVLIGFAVLQAETVQAGGRGSVASAFGGSYTVIQNVYQGSSHGVAVYEETEVGGINFIPAGIHPFFNMPLWSMQVTTQQGQAEYAAIQFGNILYFQNAPGVWGVIRTDQAQPTWLLVDIQGDEPVILAFGHMLKN